MISERLKIAALALLVLGGCAVSLSAADLSVASAAYLGVLFAMCSMPINNRAFANFCGMLVAAALALMAISFLPPESAPQIVARHLALGLFLAAAVYGVTWGAWGLISGILALARRPSPRLSGWQRLGVVVSVAWAIGAWSYTVSLPNRASADLGACLDSALAHAGDTAHCYEIHHQNYPTALAQQQQEAAVGALVPVLIGWRGAYLLIALVRWVLKGFGKAASSRGRVIGA